MTNLPIACTLSPAAIRARREGLLSGPLVAILGVLSLIAFAPVLTRVETAFTGRAYAAYGGIYIAASLVWLWAAEGQRPTATDLVGAAIAIVGALVIVGFAGHQSWP